MKKTVLQILAYIFFPVFSVFVCRIFRIAQGEKAEEVVFGIFVGILIDLIFSVIMLFINRGNKNE